MLRLALGMLKKMVEGTDEDFGETFLPLLEITDEDQKIELTKELLHFAAKAFAAHNRRLEAELVRKTLQPVFGNKGKNMIKTIFDEKYDEGLAVGEARGKARGKAETVLTLLRTIFNRIPKDMEDRIRRMVDPVALDSLAASILDCPSLEQFGKILP